jgi:hypothetical protein
MQFPELVSFFLPLTTKNLVGLHHSQGEPDLLFKTPVCQYWLQLAQYWLQVIRVYPRLSVSTLFLN